jgi:CHAT domain-containing protein
VSLQATVSAQAKLALETSLRSQQNGQIPDQNDLQTLGELLMPPEVRELLQPETYLILSPHGELHGLPWNALAVGNELQPLVEQAIPVIVPSLRSAIELWKPQSTIKTATRQRGLAVGISEFSEKFSALPFVDRELADFTPILANDGVILRNEQASWQALLQITNSGAKKGLSQFSFLHLASHFFSDSASGELSGVALWGENIYQDQLRTLAPLPELVTLSGCSSIFSRTYAGDEHVGLPTTCLIAGAKSILGSNWPVLDNTAAEFMSVFYQNYFKGLGPATALAQSQREFIRSHKDMVSWAGYCCIGKP